MQCFGKGVESAATQVKVSSPEIILVAKGQGFHFLEARIGTHDRGECGTDVPGSKAVAGQQTVYVGTWENRIAPRGSRQGAEEATRGYGDTVVGLTHSRGVDRVKPVEDEKEPLEGVSSITQRGGDLHAAH